MIFNLNRLLKVIKKNNDALLLVCLIFFTVLITQFYNNQKETINKNYKDLINNVYFKKSVNHILNNFNPKYINIDHKISAGESFDKILSDYSISEAEIKKIKNNLRNEVNLNSLKTKQIIKFTMDQSRNNEITYFLFPVSRTEKVQLTKNLETELFEKKTIITDLIKKIIFKESKISQSLYRSATELKIQANIIINFASIYGFQVDFQRDIKKNDSFQIMYEIFEDDNGKIYETGNILFANLKLAGINNSLYHFDKKGSEGHYDVSGKSVKKALMKTPINGARLSSSFGLRKHPIDGYTKLHKGTDFAAPSNTPIMASGNGVITKAKWCGGGGNCIKIKHNSIYETVYAHMSKFASGIKQGIRVQQGQTIGYVGSTGKSTGPHLHYEVIKNGKRINSQKLKLPSGKILSGKDRRLFEVKRIKLDVLRSDLIVGLN